MVEVSVGEKSESFDSVGRVVVGGGRVGVDGRVVESLSYDPAEPVVVRVVGDVAVVASAGAVEVTGRVGEVRSGTSCTVHGDVWAVHAAAEVVTHGDPGHDLRGRRAAGMARGADDGET